MKILPNVCLNLVEFFADSCLFCQSMLKRCAKDSPSWQNSPKFAPKIRYRAVTRGQPRKQKHSAADAGHSDQDVSPMDL